MTITIIGAGSMTAGALIPMLLDETDATLHLITSRELPYALDRVETSILDITDRNALKEAILGRLPNVIVNTAALTNVDKCETDRGLAWSLNVTLVEQLARMARIADAHLVHFSTDYVFDGQKGPYSELDTPHPINYYGKSKLAGENVCLGSGIPSTVVRTNVVYGPDGDRPDFVRWVLQSIDAGIPIRVVNDQYSNPTYAEDLAEAVTRIIRRRRTGLYHVGGADYMTRHDFALKIATMFKLDASLISPVPTSELQQAARRPVHGGLVTLKAETDLMMKMSSVESGLASLRHKLVTKQQRPPLPER